MTLQLADGSLLDVIEGSLVLPLVGLWTARLWLDEDTAPAEGPATLLVGLEGETPTAFTGTLGPSRDDEGQAFVELVGGAALLSGATSRHYTAAPTPIPVSDLVEDLAAEAKVELAPELGAELAGLAVARWSRLEGESWAAAIARIASRFGRSWRTRADGVLWLGAETWPEVAEPFITSEDLEATVLHASPDAVTWRPGEVVRGRRIVRVTYHASGRAELVYEADEGTLFAELIGRHSKTSPYAVTYTARVIEQREDGTLDLHLVGGPILDLTAVPFEVGVEGARVVIRPGSFVRVGFEGGWPDGAYAFGRWYEPNAQRGVARKGDHVATGTLTLTGAGALSVSYTPPGGKASAVGTITAAVAGSPVVFAGSVSFSLEGEIDSASEEVFLR